MQRELVHGFNKIMTTGNGFSNVIIFPYKQEREILFEATRPCVWLKLDVCSMCVRFATTTARPKWFNKIRLNILPKRTALSPFSYIEGMPDLQFTNLRLFPCFRIEILRSQSVYHLRLPPSRLLLPRPDSTALNDRIKRAFPIYR